MAIRRAALHISSVAMLIRRAALHISSVAMLIRRAALHTSSVAMLIRRAALHISSVKMAYLQSIRRTSICSKSNIYISEAAEQIIYWGGGGTLHEVVEHDSLISLRGKGGLYWVMMESII